MARSISLASHALTGVTSRLSNGARDWMAENWPIPWGVAGSQITATRVTPGATVERLHCCMGEVGKDVLGLDHPAGAGEGRLGIPVRAGDGPGTLRQGAIFREDLLAAALFGGRFVPCDTQALAALACRPESVRIDGDALRDLLDVDDSRRRARLRRIE
jgi:hypothetical protein